MELIVFTSPNCAKCRDALRNASLAARKSTPFSVLERSLDSKAAMLFKPTTAPELVALKDSQPFGRLQGVPSVEAIIELMKKA